MRRERWIKIVAVLLAFGLLLPIVAGILATVGGSNEGSLEMPAAPQSVQVFG